MTSLTFIQRFNHKVQQCIHCANELAADATICHHCNNRTDDEYSQFKQALNQQQGRATMITRLVVIFSMLLALGFFLSS
jgi:predicted amidophosphoribosyltransferase